MAWESIYRYMLLDHRASLHWQQHYQYNPSAFISNHSLGQNVKELLVEAYIGGKEKE